MKFALNNFIVKQFNQISEEGWPAIRRKVQRMVLLPVELFFICFALFLVFLVRLLRPLVLIRFGSITSYIIGSFVFETEYFLSKKDYEKTKSIDFFYYRYKYESHKKPPNEQWDLMVRRHFRVNPFVSYLYKANQMLPMGQAHTFEIITQETGLRDFKGVLSRTDQHIRFTDLEDNRGRKFLEEIGLKPNECFVCLLVRDSAYKEKYQTWKKDWSYHNFRDSDINTYEEVSLALAEKGYWVFRMGKVTEKLFSAKHPRILDYANTSHRNDFLDIWLMANCHFCISGGGGIDEVSHVFRRPLVRVNGIPFTYYHKSGMCITLPKKLIWRESGIQLTFMEYINMNDCHRHSDYKNAGIKIIDLPAKEITEASMEMEGRLNGTWKDSDEDDQLQKLYWKKFKATPNFRKNHGWVHPEARLGAHFLRNNHEWFLGD